MTRSPPPCAAVPEAAVEAAVEPAEEVLAEEPPQALRAAEAAITPVAIRNERREIFFIVKTSIFYLKPFDSPILMLIAQK